jgi:hypothetical protein
MYNSLLSENENLPKNKNKNENLINIKKQSGGNNQPISKNNKKII